MVINPTVFSGCALNLVFATIPTASNWASQRVGK